MIGLVHVESWRSTYRGQVPDDFLDNLSVDGRSELWRQRISEISDSANSVLVLVSDEIVGFSDYCPSRDGDAGHHNVGEVTSIYLLESVWGQGQGTALMTETLDAMSAAGYRSATLWVLDTNERARAFYESRGWVHDDAVKVDDRGAFELREVRYARDL